MLGFFSCPGGPGVGGRGKGWVGKSNDEIYLERRKKRIYKKVSVGFDFPTFFFYTLESSLEGLFFFMLKKNTHPLILLPLALSRISPISDNVRDRKKSSHRVEYSLFQEPIQERDRFWVFCHRCSKAKIIFLTLLNQSCKRENTRGGAHVK